MELIPYISQFFVYCIIVLLLVIFISFIFSRKKPENNTHDIHSVIKMRSQMRSYIEKTSFEIRGENLEKTDIDLINPISTIPAGIYPTKGDVEKTIPPKKRFTIVKGASKE